MPNLVEIVELAEALETKAVYLATDRCTVVRNRNSKCSKCSDACLADAVHAEKNKLELDFDACIRCGACTTVCPTEALIPLDPMDVDLADQIAHALDKTHDTAIFACARIASKHVGDPTKFAEVPCLGRMEESLLVKLAALGIDDIVLVDGVCKTCKYRATSAITDKTVDDANQLIEAVGGTAHVRRSSEFPEVALLQDARQLVGEARRGWFLKTRDRAKDATVKTVEVVALKSNNQVVASLRERFKISEDGTLPQFNPERRTEILDAMYEMGEPVVPEIDTRLFGYVTINTDLCNACNMCTVFCTTGALSKSKEKPADGDGSYLEFQAADCVQCNLCQDACLKKCLTVETVVPTDELFDFEPRLIWLPKPSRRPGVLGSTRNKK